MRKEIDTTAQSMPSSPFPCAADPGSVKLEIKMNRCIGIVLLAHTNFDSPFVVGSHHLKRIMEVMPAVSLTAVEPFSGWRNKPRAAIDNRVLRPKLWIPLRARQPILREQILKANSLLFRSRIEAAIANMPARRCVILDNPYAADIAIWLRSRGFRLVTRLTDWMPGQIQSPDRETNFRMLRRSLLASDKVIVTSAPLARYVQLLAGKNASVIANGVSRDLVLGANITGSRDDNRVLYYGAFDSRIDQLALAGLAREFKDLFFDIYTPTKLDKLEATFPSNVHFLKTIEFEALGEALETYSFGMLPFKNVAANHTRFPMKLFELIGTGVQVISPPILSLIGERTLPGLTLSEGFGTKSLANTLRSVTASWQNKTEGERASIRAQMQERALAETWEKKAQEVLDICQSLS